MRKNTIHMK